MSLSNEIIHLIPISFIHILVPCIHYFSQIFKFFLIDHIDFSLFFLSVFFSFRNEIRNNTLEHIHNTPKILQ